MKSVDIFLYLTLIGIIGAGFIMKSGLTFIIKCILLIFIVIYEGFTIYYYLYYKKRALENSVNPVWPPKLFTDNTSNCPDYWVDDTVSSGDSVEKRCVNVFEIPMHDNANNCVKEATLTSTQSDKYAGKKYFTYAGTKNTITGKGTNEFTRKNWARQCGYDSNTPAAWQGVYNSSG
jgi:hypothetical protein